MTTALFLQWTGEGETNREITASKNPGCVAASIFGIRGSGVGEGGKLLIWDVKKVIIDKFGICLSSAFEPYAPVGSLQLLVVRPGSWARRKSCAPGRLGELVAPVLLAAPAKEHLTGLAELDPELTCLSAEEIKNDAGTKNASQGHQLCKNGLQRLLDTRSYKRVFL